MRNPGTQEREKTDLEYKALTERIMARRPRTSKASNLFCGGSLQRWAAERRQELPLNFGKTTSESKRVIAA